MDAVEIAIRVLEDREITNAGYGSNLAMDGVVECDAVVVDHFGRSGAAGAVARMFQFTPQALGRTLLTILTEIKNPISLARILLDHTTQQLSLRRVPPNLLVGQGATEFAYNHGMPVTGLDTLISPAARDRWRRWRRDLHAAEKRQRQTNPTFYTDPSTTAFPLETTSDIEIMRRNHAKELETAAWIAGQPMSPPPTSDDRAFADDKPSPGSETSSMTTHVPTYTSSIVSGPEAGHYPYSAPETVGSPSKNPFANSTQQIVPSGATSRSASRRMSDGGLSELAHDELEVGNDSDLTFSQHQSSMREATSSANPTKSYARSPWRLSEQKTLTAEPPEEALRTALPATPNDEVRGSSTPLNHVRDTSPLPPNPSPLFPQQDEDLITDTVGAIAIDLYGNIACGASSGGIGMKHRGRIGPAALCGVGAAVIPFDADDPELTTVASVASGTGEHMGTTSAAHTCSERVYHGLRKLPGGRHAQVEDDEAMASFISKDFMGHPSVKQSASAGAIGILSVKKTNEGAWLYFGHNTDSFALASMHSDEAKPVATMSRKQGGSLAQGGRGIRFRKRK